MSELLQSGIFIFQFYSSETEYNTLLDQCPFSTHVNQLATYGIALVLGLGLRPDIYTIEKGNTCKSCYAWYIFMQFFILGALLSEEYF